jgi:hypothetical protein
MSPDALTEFPSYMKQAKGFFPYEFMESKVVLQDTKALPPKDTFNN